MKAIVIMIAILALLVACAPAQTAEPTNKQTAPDTSADGTSGADNGQDEPVVEAAPAEPVREMDADTKQRLTTALSPGGVKLALSHTSIKMKIGESRVIGVGLRGITNPEDNYQVNYSLRRAYDKSTSPIVGVDTNAVLIWMDKNGVNPWSNTFGAVTLKNKETKTYPFLLTIKPTLSGGAPTQPGTYVFNFKAYNQKDWKFINYDYAEVDLTVLVEA